MEIANLEFDAVVVGAGPAGTSLAIRLAAHGKRVALVERDRFPRHKLCGEFISPECIDQFRELGVESRLLTAGGDRISETLFYTEKGDSVSVMSDWFDSSAGGALGLSRAEMDLQLMNTAREKGATIIEGASLIDVEVGLERKAQSILIRLEDGETKKISADMFVDATGRSRVLTNLVLGEKKKKSHWVAFKAHFQDVQMDPGRCEIYFFEGGYGGLSFVERGFANHCFLIRSDVARRNGGNADEVFENVVLGNRRASEVFEGATREFKWLAVAIDQFGFKTTNSAENVFAVGDAAAFIDPFTGSGMLLALQSARLFAEISIEEEFDLKKIEHRFRSEYQDMVRQRLRICGLMRRLSFSPAYANVAVKALKHFSPLRQVIARATRHSFGTH